MRFFRTIKENGMFFGANVETFDLATTLRKRPTKAEKEMWQILRRFRKSGFVFRRQHPIEFYIADFYCHKLRMVIEVDGEIHSQQDIRDHDESRTAELERLNIKVVRFTNEQVLNEGDYVFSHIKSLLLKMK